MTQNLSWDDILTNFEIGLDDAYSDFKKCKETLVEMLDELENATKDEFVKYHIWKARNDIEKPTKLFDNCEKLRLKLGQEVVADKIDRGDTA